MITRIGEEIILQREFLTKKKLSSIYLGGGTPSLLDESELGALFENIHKIYVLEDGAEITLEANPEDLTPEKLKLLKKFGINRLSIGIQSFQDSELHLMNRNHTGKEAEKCLENVQNAGFENFNIDLIYSIPGSSMASLSKNIELSIKYQPKHVSAYCFTIEKHTVFAKWAKEGKVLEIEDNQSFIQYEKMISTLANSGLHQYEISNFAQIGFHSRHNSTYWEGKEYLGVGPSAHSFNLTQRFSNISNNIKYIQSIKNNQIPLEVETLTKDQKINEFIMTGIRQNKGLDLSQLAKEFEVVLLDSKTREIDLCQTYGYLKISDGRLILSNKGRFLSNTIISLLIN